jgi:hypothetical protein
MERKLGEEKGQSGTHYGQEPSPTRIRTRSCGGPAKGQGRRSYKLHTAAAPVEDLDRRGGSAGGGPGQADIKGASSRSHELAAERPELRLGEQESTALSTHCWTGTTCWAASLHTPTGAGRRTSCDHGWAGSKAVETTMASRVRRAAEQDVSLEEF